jgi:hypothetical protein
MDFSIRHAASSAYQGLSANGLAYPIGALLLGLRALRCYHNGLVSFSTDEGRGSQHTSGNATAVVRAVTALYA